MIGRAVGQQVRVRLSSDAFGLYTAREVHPEDPDTIVRMGRRGRERLGTSDEFDGVVDSVGPHPPSRSTRPGRAASWSSGSGTTAGSGS
jgi:hypothetical protein